MRLCLLVLCGGAALAQTPAPKPPIVREGATVKLTNHVWVIPDDHVPMVPNVGIIIGKEAILVIDTGLGPRNARTVLREVEKIAKRPTLYLVTTHFHPEHAGGSSEFPPTTKFVLSRIQQQDLDELGMGMMETFSRISPVHAELLKDVRFRKADILFDREYTIHLGGVDVELRSWGPTHTRGDTTAWVKQDRVLFSGDIVMSKTFLSFGKFSGVQGWIDVLNQLEKLKPSKIVPSHGSVGDASLTPRQRTVFLAIQSQAKELKQQGKTMEQAVPLIEASLKSKYPDWTTPARIAPAARAAFTEAR